MKLFITGASGFVGGAVVEHLRDRHQIKAMSRTIGSDDVIKALGAEPVRCDLNSISAQQLAGCDCVIHAAARAEDWGKYDWFYQTNVVGTEKLLQVAREAGVKRFIFVGTESALFYGRDLLNVDESAAYALDSPYPYAKTKALAEQAVLRANSRDFATLSLRPCMVWGPKDQSILPVLLATIDKGNFAWINGGEYPVSTTFVGNFCHAVDLALEGAGGEAYFITDNENTSLKEFFEKLLATQGVKAPDKTVPAWLLRTLAFCIEKLYAVFAGDRRPPLTRFAAAILSSARTINIEKARRDLGYEPIYSREQGLALMTESQSTDTSFNLTP